MKKSTKIKCLGIMALIVGGLALTGCTQNFCSNFDKASIAYPYEQGVTIYVDRDEIPEAYQGEGLSWQVFPENDELYAYIPVDRNGNFTAKKAQRLNSEIIANALTNNYTVPSFEYFKQMDQLVLEEAIATAIEDGVTVDIPTLSADDINPFSEPNCVGNEIGVSANENSILRNYGYVKFYGDDGNNWTNWTEWNHELALTLGASNCPSNDFVAFYQNNINTVLNNARSCITTASGGSFGHYGQAENWEVALEAKDWGYAWGKGFLEGLIVYPVAWLVDVFSVGMDPALTGFGQILAIVFVTIIVRIVVLALTFKSTMDQQKTQALQPQLAKLQAKYPNSNTNQAEKARLAQEQMALYKRNHINPFSMILVLIIQFPVFISVWGALQGSAVLSSGEFLNMSLSSSISSILFNFTGEWYLNSTGFWTALILFLLMSVSQWLAMMLPQWITKRRIKKLSRTTANPAQDRNTKTMKWVSYGMLIMTILMGFALPSAMGVYWLIGSFVSMLQTVFTQLWMAKRMNKKEKR